MSKKTSYIAVETLKHDAASRKNIPTAEYESVMPDAQTRPVPIAYERRNRDLDPQLVWRGKDEQDWSDLIVQAPPLYIQEKVHPKVLIDDLLRQSAQAKAEQNGFQIDLFADFNGLANEDAKTEFYAHDQNWSNRMILGDSLHVMASLAEREGLRGKVQCIYFDPPYGIKFNSNFQWSTTSRDVKDGKADHITREPEQVKAFRDTWRDGIHSYLTYLRDRLTVARDLLTESGSIFVQIGDENVHRVRAVMDEVFGVENFVSEIVFTKTRSLVSSDFVTTICDYILWFSKNKLSAKGKVRKILIPRADESLASHYQNAVGEVLSKTEYQKRKLEDEKYAKDFHPFMSDNLIRNANPFISQVWQGRKIEGRFRTSETGIQRAIKADRILFTNSGVRYKFYLGDFSASPLNHLWADVIGAQDLTYVVQTNTRVVERCMLMTTDPGDLVLDPTCVRKGTRVFAPPPGPLPQAGGGEKNFPPLAGGLRGGQLQPIEHLKTGDHVYAHDGKAHRILRVIEKPYQGEMIEVRHEKNAQALWLTADHRVLAKLRPRTLGGNNDWSGSPFKHIEWRKQLRADMTPPERALWSVLRGEQIGWKFRRQSSVGPYIADFYSREARLVVEVDGATHAEPEAILHDQRRDAYMRELGLTVLRFSAREVNTNLRGVREAIYGQCALNTQEVDGATWVQAGALRVGDVVFALDPDSQTLEGVPICAVQSHQTEETVYDLEVEGAHSFITEVCAVHNCGSGTTATVAEQWGRRWITIDTSRVALALARARIMGARYPFYLLADSREGQIKEAEVTRTAPSTQPVQGNIRHGFVYERVPHITLKSIANNTEIDVIWEQWQATLVPLREKLNAAIKKTWQEWEIPREADAKWPDTAKQLHADWWQARIARQREIDKSIAAKAEFEYLYDKPYDDKKKVRVAGPFTVESLSPHRVLGVDENDELIDTLKEDSIGYGVKKTFAQMILENLRTAGVQQAHKADRITFTSLTPWPGEGHVCAEGRYIGKVEGGSMKGEKEMRAGIFIGPEFGTVQRADLVEAARECGDAGFDVLIACAFNYEAHTTEFSKLGRIPVLKARMNADLHMAEDLKNTGKGNLFVIFGEPDITLISEKDPSASLGQAQLRVKVNGVDVFKPQTGEVISDGADGIACWFIDTDYNGESFFVRHAYFLGANDPYSALKTTLKAEINAEAWATLNSDTSRPFEKPKNGRIAVKVINHLGDEVMKVFKV